METEKGPITSKKTDICDHLSQVFKGYWSEVEEGKALHSNTDTVPEFGFSFQTTFTATVHQV